MRYINTPVFIYLDNSGNGLSILRELSKHKIPVHAFSDSKKNPSFKSRYGVKDICPPPTDEPEFIEFLIKKSSQLRIKPVFVPTTDSVLNLLIKYHSLIAKYFLFPFEDPNRILALLDKVQLTKICRKYQITYPETQEWIASSEKEKPPIREMSFPILIKPIYHGKIESFHKRKLFVIDNKQEWEKYSEVIQENKVDVIIQEAKKDCRHFGFYAYFDGRRFPDSYLLYEKILQYPDQFGTGVLCKKTDHEGIGTEVTHFIDKYPFRSIAEIEFAEERDSGRLYLIEINPRSIVPNSLTTRVGVNVILDAYSKVTGYQSDHNRVSPHEAFWIDEGGLLSYLLEHKGKGAPYFLKLFVKRMLKTRDVSFSYFDLTDILPFLLCLKRTLSPFLFSVLKRFR
jgi:predicted ATP-grasp superfamily ATP-dependent carboligase